jgi:hypothetical protein
MFAAVFFPQYAPYETYPGRLIAEQYRSWDSAYVRGDAHAAGDVLSKDFKLVTGGGTEIDKATYLVSFGSGELPQDYSTKMIRIRSQRAKAKVWTKETADDSVHYYLDMWVLERGNWRLLGSRTLREDKK